MLVICAPTSFLNQRLQLQVHLCDCTLNFVTTARLFVPLLNIAVYSYLYVYVCCIYVEDAQCRLGCVQNSQTKCSSRVAVFSGSTLFWARGLGFYGCVYKEDLTNTDKVCTNVIQSTSNRSCGFFQQPKLAVLGIERSISREDEPGCEDEPGYEAATGFLYLLQSALSPTPKIEKKDVLRKRY